MLAAGASAEESNSLSKQCDRLKAIDTQFQCYWILKRVVYKLRIRAFLDAQSKLSSAEHYSKIYRSQFKGKY